MYLVLDTETGGTTTYNTLFSVAGIILDEKLNEVDWFHVYTRPENVADYNYTEEALKINGIVPSLHFDNADSYDDASEYITYKLGSYTKQSTLFVPVGWNVGFDTAFISAYLPKVANYLHYRKLDVQSVAQFKSLAGGIPHGSLSHWAKEYGIDTSGAHDALFDCRMTLALLKRFLAE